MKKVAILIALFVTLNVFDSCDKNDNIILFSVNDDIKLGSQVSDQIESDPVQFPILSETEYPEAYTHIRRITNTILNSGNVKYKDEFAWEVKIIYDDEVLNAFCTPGGYIYVYTGLIKYLDTEDQLAGVMGHEIGHADLRHSSRQLQTQYGISFLLGLAFGENQSQLETVAGQIAGTVVGLKYSRTYESEADDNSVKYLKPTDYACNGASGFFKKIRDEGHCSDNSWAVWLSTHPDPCDRIDDIDAKALEESCSTDDLNPDSYLAFKNSLP
ncbi:M48 family metalloprotease [Bacteroidota bacterium]